MLGGGREMNITIKISNFIIILNYWGYIIIIIKIRNF